jgi:Protein of unknown function (DUF3617)
MMMTKYLLDASRKIPAIALLCAAAVSPAAADGISPGLWQVTETVIMNGRAAAPQVRTRCLSTEQAGDTAATFTPEYRAANPNCDRAEFLSTSSKLKWRMLCKGQMEMDVSGDFTFDTPKHYSATIQSKGSMGGQEVVNSSVAIEGEHLGECQ